MQEGLIMLRKWSAMLIATTLLSTLGVTVAVPGPANAAASCAGYVTRAKTVDFSAFAGHKVRATYTFCFVQKTTFVGPPNGIRLMNAPTISFPSRSPGSLGETVSLTTKPYNVKATGSLWTNRFAVTQGSVAAPIYSNFDFDLHLYGNGTSRICFVGRSCSPYQ